MKKLLWGFLLLVSALAPSTQAGAASVTLGQAGAGGVSAIITPDPGEIGQPANIWIGGILNGTLYLRNGPSTWAEYRGGPLAIALTNAALPSSLQVKIVDFDISSLPGLDVYVGYGNTEASLPLSGHLAKVYTTIVPGSWTGSGYGNTPPSAGISQTATAQVTWNLISLVGNVGVYTPTGTVSATAKFGDAGCSLDPSSHIIGSGTDGLLTIDFNTTPPTYHGTGMSSWPLTLTCVVPPVGVVVTPGYTAELPFFAGSGGSSGQQEAAGVVSPDGMTIEGSATVTGTIITVNWKFTRNQ